MTIFEKHRTKNIIKKTAKLHGTTTEQCRVDMQEVIDAAWSSADPAARARQNELFPNGKPTVEEFLNRVAAEIKKTS